MALLVGLGNPGPGYVWTRHNVGWRVLDLLAERWKAGPAEPARTYETRRAVVETREVDLLKPHTYMNLSGKALAAWHERHPFDVDDLLVIADDVYLPLGIIRMRAQGSSGGHRGLESIQAALQSDGFARLRVGVGAAADAEELGEHVLEEFSEKEESIALDAIAEAADAADCWAREGIVAAMNKFNRRVRREVSEP